MKKRQEIEKFIKDWIYKITQSKFNVKLYEDLFSSMDDKQFEQFMNDLRTGKKILQVIIPTDGFDGKIDLKRNISLAKELGFDFFQHLTIGPDKDLPQYITPEKFMVLTLPFRRTKQTLEKGISVAESSKQINPITGQVKDDDATSKMTYPELQVLIGLGVKTSLVEIMRDRGGDITANTVMKNALLKFGRVSKKVVDLYAEGAMSTKALKNYLTAMHLKNTL